MTLGLTSCIFRKRSLKYQLKIKEQFHIFDYLKCLDFYTRHVRHKLIWLLFRFIVVGHLEVGSSNKFWVACVLVLPKGVLNPRSIENILQLNVHQDRIVSSLSLFAKLFWCSLIAVLLFLYLFNRCQAATWMEDGFLVTFKNLTTFGLLLGRCYVV